MYQRWRSLLFLHFPCPASEIQALLPPGLTVDTFDGMAWVGFVPFRMEGVRPRGVPAVRACSNFPETNVRTYVHREGREPGVWFFSLDAANGFACRVARMFWALPYFHARMSVVEAGATRTYTGRREDGGVGFDVEARFGEALPFAEPGTLEFFLIERYLLYAYHGGRLFTGRVHHSPYPLRTASVLQMSESLLSAAGVEGRPFVHQIASDGVDVDIFGIQAVG